VWRGVEHALGDLEELCPALLGAPAERDDVAEEQDTVLVLGAGVREAPGGDEGDDAPDLLAREPGRELVEPEGEPEEVLGGAAGPLLLEELGGEEVEPAMRSVMTGWWRS
jgi:hypothetical protein